MAKDDFFLSFGTDADVFASKIEAESDRASQSIIALTHALADYDATLAQARNGGPLRTLFGALDEAAGKFGKLTTELVGGMNRALGGVSELTDELAGLVDAVNKINELKPKAKQRTAQATAEITDDDIIATDKARRSGKALGEVIELNATQARNALKRVADINATVGRNSNAAADGLKELARQIRELNGAAKEAKGRGTFAPNVGGPVGGGGPQVIVVQNGTVQTGAGVNIQTIVDEALKVADGVKPTVSEPQPETLTDAAVDAAINQGSKKRPLTKLTPEEYAGPARSGRYILPHGEERGFGFDIREGETYEQYVARNNKVREVVNLTRENLPQPDRSDLADYRRFKQTGGSEANEVFQRLTSRGVAPKMDEVKASFENIRIGGLTKPQMERLPGVLARIAETRIAQSKMVTEALRHIIDEDPFATFQGGALGSQNLDIEVENTFARQLEELDAELAVHGSTAQMQGVERRRDARETGQALRFKNDPTYTVRPEKLVDADSVATRDQEGMTQKQVKADNARRRKEAREKNKQAVADYLANKGQQTAEEAEAVSEESAADDVQANTDTAAARPARKPRRPSQKGALRNARALVQNLERDIKALGEEEEAERAALQAELDEARALVDQLRQARAPGTGSAAAGAGAGGTNSGSGRRGRTGGRGGGGGTPPPPPPNAGAAGEGEPDETGGTPEGVYGKATGRRKSSSGIFQRDYSQQIALLQQNTRALLEDAKARLADTRAIADQTERLEAQRRILIEAGAALKNDPHFKNFPNLETARGTFAQSLGLPASKENYATVRELFTQGGAIDSSGLVNKARQTASAPSSVPGASEPTGTLGRALFGQRGFLDAQLRHIGLAIENFAGFQLVFTGFEKLKELVETGLETEVTFVRLKATLDASGRSANGLRSAFSRISAETGEDLKKVTEAAAELAGVFQDNSDLVKGTEIAAQLANISQGTLTAKDAAIGLRDVTDAYAISGAQGIQQVGDQIARLSVVTGVSVKDITEGATQLAQEAHEFGLNQRQAVTLTAFVTKSTGESGEQAAEQTSRLLSTLTTTKVQDTLVRFNVATREQFAGGDIAGVITNLIEKFDELSPSARQAIQSLVGAGRQARAFTGLVRDGSQIVEEFNNSQNDLGTLARQNSAILGTVSGNIKQLGEDFRNVGQTLQQLGVFDILGVIAKSVDLLLQSFNKLGQGLADVFNSNPITRNLKDLVAVLLEAAVAFKVLGPVAASVMGKLGLGSAAKAAQEVEARAAAAAAGVPYVAPAPGTTRRNFTQFAAPAGAAPFIGPLQEGERRPLVRSEPFIGPLPAGTTVRPQVPTGETLRTVRPFAPLGAVGRGLGGAAASVESAVASRELGLMGAAAARAAGASRALSGALINLGEVMIATGAETRAASIKAGALNGAMIGLAIAVPLVIKGFHDEGEAAKQVAAILSDLKGEGPKDDDPAKKAEEDARAAAQQPGSYGKAYKDLITGGPKGTSFGDRLKNIGQDIYALSPVGYGQSIAGGIGDLFHGDFKGAASSLLPNFGGAGSGGVTSEKFDKAEGKLMSESFAKLRNAKTPEEEAAALAEINQTIADQSEELIKSAGDVDAQKSAAADLENLKNKLNEAGTKRIERLKGLDALDVLTVRNIEGVGVLVGTISNFNKQTLAQIGGLLTELESDQGFQTGSAVDNNFKTAFDPNRSNQDRRRAQIAALQASLEQGQDTLKNDARYNVPGQARDQLEASLTTQANQLAQLQQAELQNAQAVGAAQADFLDKVGNPAAASTAMQASVDGIVSILSQLDSTQPEYFAALSQLIDAELKTAQLASLPEVNKFRIAASKTADPLQRAQQQQKIAEQNLKDAQAAQAAADPKIIDAAQEAYDKAQADLDRITAERDAADPSDRKFYNQSGAIANAQAKRDAAAKALADAKAQSGSNSKAVTDAEIAKNEADLAVAQAQADQDLSKSQLDAATLENAADQVGADRTLLEGLQGKTGNGGALAAAIKNYGTNSAQANQIRIQIIHQKKKLDDDLTDALNAALDLEIATLTARGQEGDLEKAAQDQTQQIQNLIDAYKKRTGDTSLSKPEGQRLQAQLVTAQRNQFDVALQAQLDTLDFQRETYKITSSQEVQALQEILKNKQLTLKEQRDITLKIKNLQESIRQQLTGGGFNIPSDIKLPTAYQVRRSLGGASGNGQTTVNNVTNASNQVTVNNNVPTAAVAQQIANQVITLINSQTSQSARANTSTPRLVGS